MELEMFAGESARVSNLGIEGLMPDAGKNRLVLIAGACLIAGMMLVGIPIDTPSALRFFLGGVLIGAAILIVTLSRWTWFK